MSMMASLVAEVEAAIGSGDPVSRVETLRRMTNLFSAEASRLREEHVSVFDEVILRLARNLEFRARIELSERMADIGNAPRQVVRDLVFDPDVRVAGPVLERSPRIEEGDLVTVARERGQDHLYAISRRTSLSEVVTDVLVDRGDRRVVHSVAGNEGARFSDRGFDRLTERAKDDDALTVVLQGRRDLPSGHLARLVAIARDKARSALRSEFGEGAERVVEAALAEAGNARLDRGLGKALIDDFTEAKLMVQDKARTGGLTEEDIAEWVKAERMDAAIVALAHLANVPVEMVSRAYHASHYDPLLFIVRAIRFGWGTFKMLLVAKSGRQLPHDVMKSAFDSFQQLSVATAQRVVRFTAVREHALQPNAA